MTVNATVIVLDGVLKATAGAAVTGDNGGGSGGSVYVTTAELDGVGSMESNGGDGHGNGGGGAGGRIAVYTTTTNEYIGSYSSYGGDGKSASSAPRGGGSGTIFTQDMVNSAPHRKLFIDHLNRHPSQYVTLDESNVTVYEFEECHISRKAALDIVPTQPYELHIHDLEGDRSGLLHAHKDQRFVIEYVESVSLMTKLPVNIWIDSAGEMIFPATLNILGDGYPTPSGYEASFHWRGRLTNVLNLILHQGALVFIQADAHTAVYHNHTYTHVGTACEFSFGP
ncbi:hypothetical protein BSL78_29832 [Apostichopus japonicus]|uniref:Uncharacterized protein n=1 Tax=Stichopus japonicus TaxID=307972 RepID=A0A2G8JCC7_STIJA|nr:hypothetical protein BSL78_29832 [Apostichopus japonicus]